MKIKMVKIYQAVYLGPRMDTVFQTKPNPMNAGKAVEMELLPNLGVKIMTPDNSIIVPFANIAYIDLAPETAEPAARLKPAKSA